MASQSSTSTIRFSRARLSPIIPRTPGTFYSVHVANPDLLLFKGKVHLYFRGQAEPGYDQIGVAYATPEAFDGVHWEMCADNPVISVSRNRADFDSGYILDPAAIAVDNRVYLYYSAHRYDWQNWNIPSHIGLAISDDGTHFSKYVDNPIIEGTAPEIVWHKNRLVLFFQKRTPEGNFNIYCCPGRDAFHFEPELAVTVFGPSKQPGAFDSYSISTVRIFREHDWFYMFYGGCDRFFDYPCAIGLARSRNLLEWERYPGNPVFERGEAGTWDEGALWFATVYKEGNTYFMWYEGTGTGLGLDSPEARAASRLAVDEDYGGYRTTSFSQIGLAVFERSSLAW
ncbi:hypothetical protein JXJ21_12900 [candidate division KSB1 bacterium]|nr:hypothetical protein [candidate division KSB1 bacterium]